MWRNTQEAEEAPLLRVLKRREGSNPSFSVSSAKKENPDLWASFFIPNNQTLLRQHEMLVKIW